jgi:hypothetical protein
MRSNIGSNLMEWSRDEVEAIVADYLKMLSLELSGQTFNKSAHRRVLQIQLNQRSDSSVEFKHCNLSAAMIDLGYPYIRGYQPRGNYQSLLYEVATAQVRQSAMLDTVTQSAVQQPAVTPTVLNFSDVVATAPNRQFTVSETFAPKYFSPIKRDYLAQEARNQSLGLAGEEFVLQYEHWRLVQSGQQKLADRVEHVSKTRGDGLGYDVLSFDSTGRERLLEVKTTSFGKDTPFFVSRGELTLSKDAAEQFHLYRLFEFRKTPKLFSLKGALDQHCILDPVTYRASFS